MSLDRQKKLELFHLEKFRELRPELILTEPERPGPPAPDFIFKRKGTTLGIEHTQLLHSDYLIEQENLRGRIIRQAQKNFENCGQPPVQVAIHFNTNYQLNKNRVENLATAAASIVRRNFPDPTGRTEVSSDWNNRNDFPEEFDCLSISRFSEIGNYWRAPGVTWVPTLGATCLQAVIDKKLARFDGYRQRCDELWLLIVSDGFQLASIVDFEKDVISQPYSTKFNRMFLLHNLTKVYELERLAKPYN